MKSALERVTHVFKTSSLAPHLAYVRCKDGFLAASDGRLYVAAPVDTDADFLVHGRELERALGFGDGLKMVVGEDKLTFSKGRSRIGLKLLSEDHFFDLQPPDTWRPVPAGYFEALGRAARFASENASQGWALGVMHIAGCLVATNNVALVAVECEDAAISGVVPTWLIDFVQKLGEEPVGVFDTETAIYLSFSDGAWLRSSRIEASPPVQMQPFVEQLLDRDDDVWQIPSEWREVYRKTLEFSTRDISVTPTAIEAHSDTASVETEISSPVPFDTLWDHKFLGPVLDEATRWDIANCGTVEQPAHTFWCGNGIRGLIASKRRISV